MGQVHDVVLVEIESGHDQVGSRPVRFFGDGNGVARIVELDHAVGSWIVDRIGEDGGDRKRVVEGKRVSVRVDLGGRRLIKNKKRIQTYRGNNGNETEI